MLKTSRHLLLFLLVSLLTACSQSSSGGHEGKTASATVVIDLQTQSQAIKRSPFIGTIDDITSITVDVLEGSTPVITGQQLVNNNGVWSGLLPDLPIGPPLTFVGHAYNVSDVQIFTGTTVQALTGTNDSVTILMAPVSDGVPSTFPKITGIIVPSQIMASHTETISILIEAGSGETLTYAATAEPGGGSFSPSSGSISLSGTTGTLVLSYTAPSTTGTYTHSIRVTNSQSNWVETNFSTVVVPSTVSPPLVVQFAPVVTAIGAQRSGSDVTFTAVVSDAGPLDALTYSWGFDGGLTFADNTVNPAVLQGYDETKSGNLTLTVTNGAGGATIVSYYVAPGLLPDNIQMTANPTYTVTYDGNGNTGGSVPSDSSSYELGQTVTVLGNTGNLVNSGYAFAGWNTQADGSGTGYCGGSQFSMGTANVTLYAQWVIPSDGVVISQIYGAGGSAGATYTNDFVELFNATANAVSIGCWSLQYGSALNNFTQKVNIPADTSIEPGHYFLVQMGAGVNGSPLPTPDITSGIQMSASNGKVALVNNTTLLTCGASGNSCSSTEIIDLVGYGSTASDYEGAGPADYAGSSTESIFRVGGGCVDTNDNLTDFEIGAVSPRNSATAANLCQ